MSQADRGGLGMVSSGHQNLAPPSQACRWQLFSCKSELCEAVSVEVWPPYAQLGPFVPTHCRGSPVELALQRLLSQHTHQLSISYASQRVVCLNGSSVCDGRFKRLHVTACLFACFPSRLVERAVSRRRLSGTYPLTGVHVARRQIFGFSISYACVCERAPTRDACPLPRAQVDALQHSFQQQSFRSWQADG